MALVLDEHQEQWLVESGDPGWPAVQHLTKLGYSSVVLPLSILIHGRRQQHAAWPTREKLMQLSLQTGRQRDIDRFMRYFSLFEQAQALEEVPAFMIQ